MNTWFLSLFLTQILKTDSGHYVFTGGQNECESVAILICNDPAQKCWATPSVAYMRDIYICVVDVVMMQLEGNQTTSNFHSIGTVSG